jgi:hypothetical protein
MKIMLCLLEDVFIVHWQHAAKGKKANLSIGVFSSPKHCPYALYEASILSKPFSAIKGWLPKKHMMHLLVNKAALH